MGGRRWKEDRQAERVFLADWRLEAALLTLVPLSLTPDSRSVPAAILELTPNKMVGLTPETSCLWVCYFSYEFSHYAKSFYFDGLKRFVVQRRLSWRGFNSVVFPSFCVQMQKVDFEIKECFGVACRRRDRTCPGNTIHRLLFSCRLSFLCGEHSRMDLFVSGYSQPWYLADISIWASDCLSQRRAGWQINVSLSVHSWDIM